MRSPDFPARQARRLAYRLLSMAWRSVHWYTDTARDTLLNHGLAALSWPIGILLGWSFLVRLGVAILILLLPPLLLLTIHGPLERAAQWGLDSYVSYCASVRVAPRIRFVLYLRPFAVDYSSRFYYSLDRHTSELPCGVDRSPESIGARDQHGRPHGNEGVLVSLSSILAAAANGFGGWVQVEPSETLGGGGPGAVMRGPEWPESMNLLCSQARVIIFVPLFDIDLADARAPTWDWAKRIPVPQLVQKTLAEQRRLGLERELALVSRPSILQKVIFVIPQRLSAAELERVRDFLAGAGIRLPDPRGVPEWGPRITMYRCTRPGEEFATGVSVVIDGTRLHRAFWTIEDSPRVMVGNPLSYLLENTAEARQTYEDGYRRATPMHPHR